MWKWYDGAYAPPTIKDLPAELDLPAGLNLPGQGALFIGEQGSLLLPHIDDPILFPKDRFRDTSLPDLEPIDHYRQWVDACLGRTQTSANFGYAGPLTEALLLGVVANRFPNQRLNWDAANLQITNVSAANALLKRSYREGFEVKELT